MSKRSVFALCAVLLTPVLAVVVVVAILLVDRDSGGGRLTGEIRSLFGEAEGGRLNQRHIIPAGIVGWISTQYEATDAPALEEENGFLIHEYSDDGSLETSSPRPHSRRKEFFYRNGDSLEPLGNTRTDGSRMIWGDYSQRVTIKNDDGTEIVQSSVYGFFVGDREQYREAPPAPADRSPLPPMPPLPPTAPTSSE